MPVEYNVKRIMCIYEIIILIPLVFIFVTVKNTKNRTNLCYNPVVQYNVRINSIVDTLGTTKRIFRLFYFRSLLSRYLDSGETKRTRLGTNAGFVRA